MSFKQVIELADLLDDGRVTGEDVVKYVTAEGNVKATCTTVTGAKGSTCLLYTSPSPRDCS